jgi:hypothetical protein
MKKVGRVAESAIANGMRRSILLSESITAVCFPGEKTGIALAYCLQSQFLAMT